MRDLRDHAGRVHVAAEDLAVEAERDHALLDPGAGALVDADDRAAGLDGEVHHLGDLLAVDLAQRAAEDREVLGEHAHLAAVDGAVAGHHAVAVRALLLQAERRRPVPGQLVELDERALVEEQLDPLAGGLAALGVLLLDRLRRAGVHRLVEAAVEVLQLARRGVDVDVLRDVGALARTVRSRLWPPEWFVGQCSARDRSLLAAPTPRPRPPGRRVRRLAGAVEVVDSAPSTNAVVADRARRDDAPAGLVVVAEHQTAGRGRLDRVWETPARSSADRSRCCCARRPTPDRWPWLPLLTGLAVRRRPAGRGGRRPQVAQRRAARGPQGRRHPGRAGRDAHRAGGGARRRASTSPRRPTSCRSRPRRRSRSRRHDRRPDRPAARVPGRARRGTCAAWSAGRIADAGLRGGVRRRLRRRSAATSGSTCPSGETVTRHAPSTSTRAGRLVVETGNGDTAIGAGDVVHVRPCRVT